MESISKVELIGLADGLNDLLPSLHPPPWAFNFEVSSASVSGLDHVPGFG